MTAPGSKRSGTGKARATSSGPVASDPNAYIAEASVAELAELIRRAISDLARRPDSAVFAELLALQEVIGIALGDSARTLAEHGSWASVADVAGTSRQAAWHRWRA